MLDFRVIILMGEGVKAKNVHYIVYSIRARREETTWREVYN